MFVGHLCCWSRQSGHRVLVVRVSPHHWEFSVYEGRVGGVADSGLAKVNHIDLLTIFDQPHAHQLSDGSTETVTSYSDSVVWEHALQTLDLGKHLGSN